MSAKLTSVPLLSDKGGNAMFEVIDAGELAKRWRVPVSWIQNRTRARTPKADRIPCVRLGHYVRFEWGSPDLSEWFAMQRSR